MKIVHICLGCFYIDNYSYQENLLPKYHKKMGHDVSIIASLLSFDENGETCILDKKPTYLNEYQIPVTRLDYDFRIKKVGKFFRKFKGTSETIEKISPDIIFIHGSQFLDMINIVKYVKRNPGVKVFYDNHADFSNSARNWFSKFVMHRFLWKFTAKIIEPYTTRIYGVLPARVDFLVDVYNVPKEKIEFLPMGADDDEINFENKHLTRNKIRKELEISPDEFVILIGGKIDYAKTQILDFLRLADKLPKNVKILTFGSISKDLREEFNEVCKNEKIIYVGWLDSKKIYEYFHASDLGVFPGRHSVIWEQAVGSGLPCVFKYWQGTTHVDMGGNCEFLYTDTNKEILKVISNIINSKGKYNEMKSQSEKLGIPYFSYQKISEKSIRF